MDKTKNSTIAIIVVAIAILAAILIFAKPSDKKESADTANNDQAQTTDQATTENDAGKLGKNEVNITAANFEKEVLKAPSGKLVVVDAYAPWCPHCQKMGPVVTALSDEYAGKVIFGKMNANNQDDSVKANFDYAMNLGLQGYPTFWFYKDGKKVGEVSGELTKDAFKTEINKYNK